MSIIGIIVLVLIVVNAISCIITRIVHGGKYNIELPEEREVKRGGTKMLILLAGMMNQPEEAFDEISSIKEKEQEVNAVLRPRFSNLGWNATTSAEQLDQYIRDTYADEVEIYSISVGDKVARLMKSEKITKIFAINPCPAPSVLVEKWRERLPGLALFLEIISFVLGWIAVIPIIPTDAGRQSFALIADQVWEVATNDKPQPTRVQRTHVVLSNEDEFLDNVAVLRFYETANMSKSYNDLRMERVQYVDTPHGATSDLGYAIDYDHALRELDKKRGTALLTIPGV